MSELTLSVKSREGIGRGHSRRLRAQGRIPAVIYGRSGTSALSVAERDFLMMMRKAAGGASLINLKDEESGKSQMSVIQGTQRNPITDRFEHIDFLEVSADHAITAHIPVHTAGEPIGVKTGGGILEVILHEVEVVCLPKDLPEEIHLDVAALVVGDAIHIRDLPALPGVTYHGDPDTVVVSVAEQYVDPSTETVAAPEAAAPAEAPAEKA